MDNRFVAAAETVLATLMADDNPDGDKLDVIEGLLAILDRLFPPNRRGADLTPK